MWFGEGYSVHSGDGHNLNPWRAQRHDQRNCIIGSCIGVNQKWKFHATQNNKLSRENSAQKVKMVRLATTHRLLVPSVTPEERLRLPLRPRGRIGGFEE
jgi:hypothetical protein